MIGEVFGVVGVVNYLCESGGGGAFRCLTFGKIGVFGNQFGGRLVWNKSLPLLCQIGQLKHMHHIGVGKRMSDGSRQMVSLARSLGLNGKLVVLCLSTFLAAAVVYSAWMSGADRPFAEALSRFPAGLVAMLGFAVLFSPLIVPCMLIGWVLGWIVGGVVRLPLPARTAIAAGVLGGAAVLPVMFFYGYGGYAAENEWRILVRPLLWIVPTSAILVALIIYRER